MRLTIRIDRRLLWTLLGVLVLIYFKFPNKSVPDQQNDRISRMLRDHPHFNYNRSLTLPDPHLKTILLWNSWFYWDDAFFFGVGQKPFIDAKCPVSDCYISNNLYLMPPSEYDAILFFFPMLNEVPFTYSRNPSQSYVFVNEEPPITDTRLELSHLNAFFNLTMTYRKDSDIYWPYGSIQRIETPTPTPGINYAKGKTKLVAWFVSNCRTESHREEYVANLKKYIQVDVYGKCGDQTCWQGDQNSCYDMLEKDYKFYLSFENSFCRDYATEKFFEMLDRRIVPIVYGSYNYSSIAPEHSYIDATKMGARKLAELLKTIDQDDNLYNQFFSWKGKYQIQKERRYFAAKAFCQLCQHLHENRQIQIYQDFEAWWSPDNHCHNSGIFVTPFNKFTFDDVDLDSVKPWNGGQHAYHQRDSL